MANEPQSRKDLETAVILRAWKDDAFRRELLANPKAAIAKVTGKPLPDDLQVVVHEETAKTLHLCLPAKPAPTAGAELADEELEAVAGGASDTYSSCKGARRPACASAIALPAAPFPGLSVNGRTMKTRLVSVLL